MDYRNLNEVEKNALVEQYKKLINRMINQFYKKGYTTWDQLE
jgi:DNA-directed RNA polymerase specialized sigma subunit